jgi:hypothetical protein
MLHWLGVVVGASVIAQGGGYANLRSSAGSLKNLGRFLEAYLGDCTSDDPMFDRASCESRAQTVQREQQGKLMRIEFEDVSDQIRLAGWDKDRGAFLVHFTPIFSERGLALSAGKPAKLNAEGLPVVKNLPIWVKLPAGESEFDFRRQLERGNVRLEIIFKPTRPWAMQKSKASEPVRGVSVDLVGVRLYSGHGDNVLAEQIYR